MAPSPGQQNVSVGWLQIPYLKTTVGKNAGDGHQDVDEDDLNVVIPFCQLCFFRPHHGSWSGSEAVKQ
jgi:hypothetical protein